MNASKHQRFEIVKIALFASAVYLISFYVLMRSDRPVFDDNDPTKIVFFNSFRFSKKKTLNIPNTFVSPAESFWNYFYYPFEFLPRQQHSYGQ